MKIMRCRICQNEFERRANNQVLCTECSANVKDILSNGYDYEAINSNINKEKAQVYILLKDFGIDKPDIPNYCNTYNKLNAWKNEAISEALS